MEGYLFDWLSKGNGINTHISIFVALILGGLGFPIPEDLPLVLAGVVASQGVVSIRGIYLTSYFGVVIADQIIYFIGFLFGKKLVNAGIKSPLLPKVNLEKINTIRDGLRKKRLVYILLGRHLFPLRTATFITAGALGIPYFEFLVADAFAALISVSLVIGFGYFLGEQLSPDVIKYMINQIHYVILFATLLGLLIYFIYKKFKRNKQDSNELLSENKK